MYDGDGLTGAGFAVVVVTFFVVVVVALVVVVVAFVVVVVAFVVVVVAFVVVVVTDVVVTGGGVVVPDDTVVADVDVVADDDDAVVLSVSFDEDETSEESEEESGTSDVSDEPGVVCKSSADIDSENDEFSESEKMLSCEAPSFAVHPPITVEPAISAAAIKEYSVYNNFFNCGASLQN